ncbi:hypothetical protein WMW72_18515 [Paenibacillus filicis]|uniref:DUF5011 domain-containing protein n=1 Tax=Paenibacillus filicis TaxID=669464 RepID=A0ABU9DPC3_9BACL
MIKKKLIWKWMSILIVVSMLCSLLPVLGAQAAGNEDLEIFFDNTRIGNATKEAQNAFRNFNVASDSFAASPGFLQTETDRDAKIYADGTINASGPVSVAFKITVKDNPYLKALAEGGTAEVVVGWNKLRLYEYDCVLFWCKTRITSANFTIDGKSVLSGHTGGGDIGYREFAVKITPNTVININAGMEGEHAGAEGLFIKFRDTVRPEMTGYTFTGDGVQRTNKKGQHELYAKAKENITLSYNFSKPVRPTTLSSGYHEHFLRQPLFVNPAGDGLPTAGQEQFLTNASYTSADFTGTFLKVPLRQQFVYTYKASKFHHSGNLPLKPRLKLTDQPSENSRGPMDKSLEEKLQEAVLADAAGNVIKPFSFPNTASNESLQLLRGKEVNPFDFEKGGFRVIVDAVAPKFTKTGNGVQPEILTGVTVNKDDTIDFTVQLTEEVVIRDDRDGSPDWNPKETYLLFNNGMRAYYYDEANDENLGFNSKNLRFRMKIPAGVQVETPLLKVIALTHNKKDYLPDSDYLNKDRNVIQDYAGNHLIQPVNFMGLHKDKDPEKDPSIDEGDYSNVNSKVDWAQISIDNTIPVISFHYENDGATDTQYKKRGKITIDANDPPVPIPVLDPEYNATSNYERPSRGIYRPSNVTGPSSPAVGLVYYAWTRSDQDPLAGKETDNYAAIKRYSLAAKQPREDLYKDEAAFANLNLNVVNNKTSMIAPPAEAFTPEGSGTWYLHSWTADMTWDTARELMQYEKMKSYKASHSQQYEVWKNEAPGSEADKIFYADNKALAAVGQYDDLNVWPLEDFNHLDSNWTHNKKAMLLDNKGPTIELSSLSNDRSANVEVTTTITDEHSGLKESFYQWVKEGSEPQDIQWKPISLNGNQFVTGTVNEVSEDGKYVLYIKATDMLGNESLNRLSSPATVDSTAQVRGEFSSGTDRVYVQSHDIKFFLNRPTAPTVSSVTYSTYGTTVSAATYRMPQNLLTIPYEVGYAFNYSSVRPEGDSAYTWIHEVPGSSGGYEYLVPADKQLNGTQYLHITVKEAGANRYYFFSKAYFFDNTAPTVEFGIQENLYPRAKQEVGFAVRDTLNEAAGQYQWVKKGEPAPLEVSPGWKTLETNEAKAVIDSSNLAAGESADYKLYVYAKDKAGNEAVISTTGYFRVSKPSTQPPADAKSDLLYVYGDQEDGYTAIVQLSLDVLDKSGYEYSISPDYGNSWLRWRPYTNFVSIKVPSDNVKSGQIQVRYKTGPQADGSEGVIGNAKPLDIGSRSDVEPVYAISTLSTSRPVSVVTGIDIDITPPLGIKVVPSAVNPSAPERSGNRFHVKQNGYYSFDLTDTSNPDRKATLYAVVSNIDTTPPTGIVEKLLSGEGTTNGNVTVKLKPSEPVRITNNNGSNTYTFKENGTFTFEFLDEAGNSGTASYTLNSIDKEGPQVKIARAYTKADGTAYKKIIADGLELIEGVKLTVEKKDQNSKEFIIPAGMPSEIYMTANGVAEFTVYDALGNVTVVKENVKNIISSPPQAETIAYSLVDEEENPVAESNKVIIDGQAYARGKMKVDISGKAMAPNRVFLGTAPYQPDPNVEEYKNQISDADGKFTTTRVFSADGSLSVAVSDLLGNVNKIPITVKGLDNKAPELTLNVPTIGVAQNKPDFDFRKDLGGYSVRDNVSSPENIRVSINGLDLSRTGRQIVTYTAVDQVGNAGSATQEVVVVAGDGMLIFGNDQLISASSGETSLFESNKVSFKITGFNVMDVSGQKLTNTEGTYDLFYYSGLFREGQMKTIATKLSYRELVNGNYQVTFPKAGWYTIIVRNQEREREYATFFISKVD